MNNKKHKLPQSNKKQIQANLKQAQKKSSLLAERKVEHTRGLGLRFSPTAWAKLLYFRDKSDNEVGGFGITEADDLLCVREFITVQQQVTAVSVKFDDEAVGFSCNMPFDKASAERGKDKQHTVDTLNFIAQDKELSGKLLQLIEEAGKRQIKG